MDEVVLESDRDKNNIIKDIEELLVEKELLEKVSFISCIKNAVKKPYLLI